MMPASELYFYLKPRLAENIVRLISNL